MGVHLMLLAHALRCSRAVVCCVLTVWQPAGASNATGTSTNPNKRAKRGIPSTPKSDHRPPNISTDLDGDTGSSHNEYVSLLPGMGGVEGRCPALRVCCACTRYEIMK